MSSGKVHYEHICSPISLDIAPSHLNISLPLMQIPFFPLNHVLKHCIEKQFKIDVLKKKIL